LEVVNLFTLKTAATTPPLASKTDKDYKEVEVKK
jgi:hypothetical protein